MSKSNIPIVRQIAWKFILVQFAIVALITYCFFYFRFEAPFFLAAVTYSILALNLRNIFGKYHRAGIKLVKQSRFQEAIPYFEKSHEYFIQHPAIDKYRYLTLLSASKICYTESALCNIAFCYSQSGNGEKAIEYYNLVLKDYPENGLAITGLNMLNSVKHNSDANQK